MARPVTLFTGQWADLPLETLAQKASAMGFDGLELACWGDHFEVDKALAEPDYVQKKRDLLKKYNLGCWAISNHLVGQAVCDNIDARNLGILPADVVGDGDPEGVRQRAAIKMGDTARAAAKFGITQVNGFTGSSIWHMIYSFPPNDWKVVEAGYTDFAKRWNPIMDVFKQEGVKFGLEVHPDRNRIRFRHDAQNLGRHRPSPRIWHQLRPQPFCPPVPRQWSPLCSNLATAFIMCM